MDVNIKLESFEGPFDLLFHLIEKNEIDIYNIPIASVTDQYIAYIDDLNGCDLDLYSEFLLMAATLIEIKSRMLLPNSKFDQMIEEFTSDDPRFDLVQRLIEYRKFKNAAGYLKDRESIYGNLFYKKQYDMNEYVKPIAFKDQGLQFETDLLVEAIRKIIDKMDRIDLNRKDYFTTLKRDVYTVEDKIEMIKSRLISNNKISFGELFFETGAKLEIIVTFLAILELLKIRIISIKQESHFSEIIIIPNMSA